MNLSKNIKPISYFKANVAQVALELKASGQAMVITQNGEATMVVQSVAEYERMQETLAVVLSEPVLAVLLMLMGTSKNLAFRQAQYERF